MESRSLTNSSARFPSPSWTILLRLSMDKPSIEILSWDGLRRVDAKIHSLIYPSIPSTSPSIINSNNKWNTSATNSNKPVMRYWKKKVIGIFKKNPLLKTEPSGYLEVSPNKWRWKGKKLKSTRKSFNHGKKTLITQWVKSPTMFECLEGNAIWAN